MSLYIGNWGLMGSGFFAALFKKNTDEPFVGVDIGTSAIKAVVLGFPGQKPKLLNAGITGTPAHALSNNLIAKPDLIATQIRSLLERNEIQTTRCAFSLPGTAVFTKKITIGYTPLKELHNTIFFEASNYIPHRLDAIHLDYQVLKANGTSSMDVLLVAVKNEILNSYVDAISRAGLEPAIADVDYFALENMFELGYVQEKKKTVALINIGARYSSVSILQNGESLFSGDVNVGGRLYTDALCEALGMQPTDAEQAKSGIKLEGYDEHVVSETLDRTTEHLAGELHRQIGFFWNAAATEKSIEAIYVSGGGCQVPGLIEELAQRTGMACLKVDPFVGVEWSENFDRDYIDEIRSSLGVGIGLALRRFGDKKHALE